MQKPCIAPRSAEKPAGIWVAAIALMGACAIAMAWFPLLSLDALPSMNYNEGWNAYRQWMVFRGQALYGARGAFWTTNYPPLSFHIVAALGGAKENMVPAGRALCFASLAAVALLTAGIVRRVAGSWPGAVYAGLWLFAGLAAFDGSRRALDDPELLSAAFAIFGLFAALDARLALAAVGFSFSLFTKQDFIAFPVSVALALPLAGDWRAFAVFAATGLAASGALLALSVHFDGPFFLAELLQPRAYGLPHLLTKLWDYLLHLAVPLAIAAAILRYGREMPGRGFFAVLLLLTHLFAIGFAGGDGVGNNIFFPALIADVTACAVGLCWLERRGARFFKPALLAVTLAGAAWVPFQLRDDIAAALSLPAATAAARQAIALLKAAKGPAICEDLLLCYQAGKPMDDDPYYVKDQILIGHVRQSGIVALLRARHYGAIQLDSAAPAKLRQRFTNRVQRALLAAYRPALVSRYYVILLPVPAENPAR